MKTRLFIFFFFITKITFGQSDPSISFQTPKDYEIGGIQIVGAVHSDEKAILSISGLKVGDKVRVPGIATQKALNSLLKLQLFETVELEVGKILGDVIFLHLKVVESPRLASFEIKGIKKHQVDKLTQLVEKNLIKGAILTPTNKTNSKQALKSYFLEEGYADVSINIKKKISRQFSNSLHLVFEISKGKKVKVLDVHFFGNDQVSSKKLKKLLGIKTKEQPFKSSKLVNSELKLGKQAILNHYQNLGYLDAKIKAEKLIRSREGDWILHFEIKEGNPYYFGNITWKGNSIYSTEDLDQLLDIKKGDIYNPEKMETRLRFSMDANDVSSLYLDNGFLFFQLETLQKSIRKDTIDLEILISEGKQATVQKVIIKGNDKTHEEVIRRELFTEPGKKFSRSDIIRSQRAIANLGYFNPETINIQTPVDPVNQTVDIVYEMEEKSADQFEVSAAWAGKDVGLTGTLGVTFNNFSIKNLFNRNTWNPIPSGDGQSLSLRIQSNGPRYQSYNFSFTEPWLGGKRPQSFSIGGFYNHYSQVSNSESEVKPVFNVLGFTSSLGRRLNFPDNNFVSTTALNYQQYQLQDWDAGLFKTENGELVTNGTFYNINVNQTFARSTINHPFFPSSGSKFSLSMQFTLPYSLLNSKNYSSLSTNERFKFLEYHKWQIGSEWYTRVAGDLVLKAYGKFGFLGSYNKKLGLSPFERFRVGGNGMNIIQQGFTGTDPISLRGYEISDLENNFVNGSESNTSVFNKFGVELRYPFLKNSSFPMYILAFAEGGNAWQSINDYNPFDLKRSVGVGFRAQVPMLGLMGFDLSLGLDKVENKNFKDLFQFSFILGIDPN